MTKEVERAEPVRSQIGLADLMAIVRRLQPADEPTLLQLVRHLGFAGAREIAAPPTSKAIPAEPTSRRTPSAAPREPAPRQPLATVNATAPQRDALVVVPTQERAPVTAHHRPEWLKAVERTRLEDVLPRAASGGRAAPPVLLSRHLRALLTTLLSERHRTGRIDVHRMVRDVAEVRIAVEPPRVERWRFAQYVAVWVESGVSMAPLAADADALIAALHALLPDEKLEVGRFSTSLEDAEVRCGGRFWQGLRLPPPGSSVLIVSRFGAGALRDHSERIGEHGWSPLLCRLAQGGRNVVGLTPHPPSGYSVAFRALVQLIHWDERLTASGARTQRGRASPLQGSGARTRVERDQAARRLAEIVSLGAEVDPAYLRHARRALLPSADPGIEAELWNSPLAQDADRFTLLFRPSRLASLREALVARSTSIVGTAPESLLSRARAVLVEAHAGADSVVQLEEEATYRALSGQRGAAVEEALGHIVARLRDPAHRWLRTWAAFSLQRLPKGALDTEPGRILGQFVPDGHRPIGLAPPHGAGWQQFSSEGVGRLRQQRVWFRLTERGDEFDLDVGLSPIDGGCHAWLEVGDSQLVSVNWAAAAEPLGIIGVNAAFEPEVLQQLSEASGCAVEVTVLTPEDARRFAGWLIVVARDALSVTSGPLQAAEVLDGAVHLQRPAAQGRLRTGSVATIPRTQASELYFLRALAAIPTQPRQRDLRLTSPLQRLEGLSGSVTLGTPGRPSMVLASTVEIERCMESLVNALIRLRRLSAYGVDVLYDDEGAVAHFKQALLDERQHEISAYTLELLRKTMLARLPQLTPLVVWVSGEASRERSRGLLSEVTERLRHTGAGLVRWPAAVMEIPGGAHLDQHQRDALDFVDVVYLLLSENGGADDPLMQFLWERREAGRVIVEIPLDPDGIRTGRVTNLSAGEWRSASLRVLATQGSGVRTNFEAELEEQTRDRFVTRSRHMLGSGSRHRYPIRSSYGDVVVAYQDSREVAFYRSGSLAHVAARIGSGSYRLRPEGSPDVLLWDALARQMRLEHGGYVFEAGDDKFDWGADTPVYHWFDRLILYQLHIGTWWSPEGGPGTFEMATERLPHLAALGVTGVLLLPVTETEHQPSWGYDPLTPSAIAQRYGSPADLKRFVRRAHQLGISVYLDVVLTQVAERAATLARGSINGDGLDPTYLYRGEKLKGPGGPRWNYDAVEVRLFLIEATLRWFSEFHVDGLYLGGLEALLSESLGYVPVGPSGAQFLRELVAECRRQYPNRHLFGELGADREPHGSLVPDFGFDSEVSLAFEGALHHVLQQRSDSDRRLSEVSRIFSWTRKGRPIAFSESRDSVSTKGRLAALDSRQGRAGMPAVLEVAALTAVAIPCIYQGQELGDAERPELARTLSGWGELAGSAAGAQPAPGRAPTRATEYLRFYADLISLRLNRGGISRGLLGDDAYVFHVNETVNASGPHRVIAYQRWHHRAPGDDVLVLLNFTGTDYDEYFLGVPHGGRWHVRLDTAAYGGTPSITASSFEARPTPMHGFSHNIALAFGGHAALVLSRDPEPPGQDWRAAVVEIAAGPWTVPPMIGGGYLVAHGLVATHADLVPREVTRVEVTFSLSRERAPALVVARDEAAGVVLVELQGSFPTIAPLTLSGAGPKPHESWEGRSVIGGELRGHFQLSTTRPSSTTVHKDLLLVCDDDIEPDVGTPVLVAGVVVGHVGGMLPQLLPPNKSKIVRAVSAARVLNLLEEHLQVVKIGEVSVPSILRSRPATQKADREAIVAVRFDRPFRAQPKVVVALQKIDLPTERVPYHRLQVSARDVTVDGFDCVFSIGPETLLNDAIAAWTAVGE